jgi:DNA-binding NarL/FixJ family response regulator
MITIRKLIRFKSPPPRSPSSPLPADRDPPAFPGDALDGAVDKSARNDARGSSGGAGPDRDPDQDRGGTGEALTAREAAVAACVSQGLRNSEIAVKLHISEKTVKLHLTHIYRKLGVSSRVKLVLLLRCS